MGGLLKKKIEKWLFGFEHSPLCEDADHVDYYYKLFRSLPKSQWIALAYKVYDYVLEVRDKNEYHFGVVLSFQLNYTRTHRPHPTSLKPSLMFKNIATPPEIYLLKGARYESFAKAGIELINFKERTGKPVRLFEADYSKDPDFTPGEDADYRFLRWIDVFE